ncbi:hypothetical protein TrRE_jg5567, partial [Triparma retinervis]
MVIEKTSSSPPIVETGESSDSDNYLEMKSLESQLMFLQIQEDLVKSEMKQLKRELLRAAEEIKRIQSVPLVIGQFNELIDSNYGVLPLLQHHLYTQIGIDPPTGVLLYGPPGTGKTMMAKAVANATSATFISMVGSEFVQKYLGEGPRMVRDVFRLARENSPCVIFIDEIDAIATKRFDAQTGADREVQRILLELLTQMDGFDQSTNVKVIMATNRADTLDPALLRPGRLDRKIEFPNPDRRQKRMVFQAATSRMNLSDELDLEDYVNRAEK